MSATATAFAEQSGDIMSEHTEKQTSNIVRYDAQFVSLAPDEWAVEFDVTQHGSHVSGMALVFGRLRRRYCYI